MKILLSRAGNIDSCLLNPDASSEVVGWATVEDLILDASVERGLLKHQSPNAPTSARIATAGHVLIEAIGGVHPRKCERHGATWTVLSLEDVELDSVTAPSGFPVQGRLSVRTDRGEQTYSFAGTFVVIGYMTKAWESLLDPAWQGGIDF